MEKMLSFPFLVHFVVINCLYVILHYIEFVVKYHTVITCAVLTVTLCKVVVYLDLSPCAGTVSIQVASLHPLRIMAQSEHFRNSFVLLLTVSSFLIVYSVCITT